MKSFVLQRLTTWKVQPWSDNALNAVEITKCSGYLLFWHCTWHQCISVAGFHSWTSVPLRTPVMQVFVMLSNSTPFAISDTSSCAWYGLPAKISGLQYTLIFLPFTGFSCLRDIAQWVRGHKKPSHFGSTRSTFSFSQSNSPVNRIRWTFERIGQVEKWESGKVYLPR